jgi:hypothetical protein
MHLFGSGSSGLGFRKLTEIFDCSDETGYNITMRLAYKPLGFLAFPLPPHPGGFFS